VREYGTLLKFRLYTKTVLASQVLAIAVFVPDHPRFDFPAKDADDRDED
jgi:hypothetical protein